jgi:hypothetical protein
MRWLLAFAAVTALAVASLDVGDVCLVSDATSLPNFVGLGQHFSRTALNVDGLVVAAVSCSTCRSMRRHMLSLPKFITLAAAVSLLATACDGSEGVCHGRDRVHVGSVQVTDATTAEPLRCVELVTGDLTIHVATSKTLEALENLVQVDGDLKVSGMTDLSSFSRIVDVGGSISLGGDDLRSLRGLESLSEVGGAFEISGTRHLKDFTGLAQLSTIHGDFSMSRNTGLTSLHGLAKGLLVQGSLTIDEDSALTSTAGLAAISVGGSVSIENNDALTTVSELPRDIGFTAERGGWPAGATRRSLCGAYEVTVSANPMLTDISAMPQLRSGACIQIDGNPALQSLKLNYTGTFDLDRLEIRGDPELAAAELSNGGPIDVVNGVTIDGTNLVSLDGVRLASVGCLLLINKNPRLSSIPLDVLRVGNTAEFSDNPRLPSCAVDAFAQKLATVPVRPVCASGIENRVDVINRGNDTRASCNPGPQP